MSDYEVDNNKEMDKIVSELEKSWEGDRTANENADELRLEYYDMDKAAYIQGYNQQGDLLFTKDLNKRKISGYGWIAMFQKKIREVSALRLTGETLSVFLNLLGRVEYDNFVHVSLIDVSKEINMLPQNVSRAIRKLLECNIIAEGPRKGQNKTYILNPRLGIKGRHKKQKLIDYEKAKKEILSKQKSKTDAPKSEE